MLRIVSVLILAALIYTTGCQNDEIKINTQEGTAIYHKITAGQAKGIMDGDETFILLDVRTDGEYRERHIGGAVLIPHTEIKDRAPDELPDKETLILVYCRSGVRSAEAANLLVDMGYTTVYDFGGILDWIYETVSGAE